MAEHCQFDSVVQSKICSLHFFYKLHIICPLTLTQYDFLPISFSLIRSETYYSFLHVSNIKCSSDFSSFTILLFYLGNSLASPAHLIFLLGITYLSDLNIHSLSQGHISVILQARLSLYYFLSQNMFFPLNWFCQNSDWV